MLQDQDSWCSDVHTNVRDEDDGRRASHGPGVVEEEVLQHVEVQQLDTNHHAASEAEQEMDSGKDEEGLDVSGLNH